MLLQIDPFVKLLTQPRTRQRSDGAYRLKPPHHDSLLKRRRLSDLLKRGVFSVESPYCGAVTLDVLHT